MPFLESPCSDWFFSPSCSSSPRWPVRGRNRRHRWKSATLVRKARSARNTPNARRRDGGSTTEARPHSMRPAPPSDRRTRKSRRRAREHPPQDRARLDNEKTLARRLVEFNANDAAGSTPCSPISRNRPSARSYSNGASKLRTRGQEDHALDRRQGRHSGRRCSRSAMRPTFNRSGRRVPRPRRDATQRGRRTGRTGRRQGRSAIVLEARGEQAPSGRRVTARCWSRRCRSQRGLATSRRPGASSRSGRNRSWRGRHQRREGLVGSRH